MDQPEEGARAAPQASNPPITSVETSVLRATVNNFQGFHAALSTKQGKLPPFTTAFAECVESVSRTFGKDGRACCRM